jgi:hypothetical protein
LSRGTGVSCEIFFLGPLRRQSRGFLYTGLVSFVFGPKANSELDSFTADTAILPLLASGFLFSLPRVGKPPSGFVSHFYTFSKLTDRADPDGGKCLNALVMSGVTGLRGNLRIRRLKPEKPGKCAGIFPEFVCLGSLAKTTFFENSVCFGVVSHAGCDGGSWAGLRAGFHLAPLLQASGMVLAVGWVK